MGAFKGFKEAKRGYQSNILTGEGKYLCRIDSVGLHDTNNGELFKVTLTVLDIQGEGNYKPGEVVHVMHGTAPGKQIFQGNVKRFLAGVMDVADEEVGEADAEAACQDGGPMEGRVTMVRVKMSTAKEPDKKTGEYRQYTNYSWSPELSAEEITEALSEEALAEYFPNGLE